MRKSAGNVLLVFVTTSSRTEALKIAEAVVREKRAACVNILPSVASIFRWQGKVQKSREALLILKTTRQQYSRLERSIVALHSYEVPEVIAIDVSRGLPQYIKWVEAETTSN